jgi:predicted regulator of Ras-like GTPase activity (Roadblock/LC7/MglB family)
MNMHEETMNSKKKSTGTAEIGRLLARLNQEGGFDLSVLTDREGLPIASAAEPGQDPEVHAAVVALVQKTAIQVRNYIGFASTSEIMINDVRGRRLICRPFDIKDHEFILAVLIPDKTKSYRRLTNNAVNGIQKFWKF